MTTTRREFLKSGALASGVAVLSMYVPGFGGQEAQAAGSMHTPNVWVHIADDNTDHPDLPHVRNGPGRPHFAASTDR